MAERLNVVTDSTASLPKSVIEKTGIEVVPARIMFETRDYRDGVDIGFVEFIEKLKVADPLPTTSAPSLGEFLKVYERLPGNVISIHLGSKFSGFFSRAEEAAKEIGGDRIHPFDSQSVSLGLGFMVMEAARLVNQGATVDQITKELEDMRSRTTVFAALDTLKYAEKGGRISHLGAWVGSTLNIKPILQIKDNEITTPEKVRTRGKSLDRMVELTEALGPLERVAVVHADSSEEDIGRVINQIQRFYTGEIMRGNIGAALATHAGPGVLGVAAVRKK